ncbi:hypothetical protein [Ferirhizobium litorale]|uniref:ParB/Sulfiredoxin domain-containing protein n=1 Tax=Ferirhizobium litorale TaxID=2927786 RepID=A0AAE3U5M0_9HYPH|nr:hypothetical protein [Fererhizobium litorale]MDI7924613.1 hypothetical protein [Fererhizobium litorale]
MRISIVKQSLREISGSVKLGLTRFVKYGQGAPKPMERIVVPVIDCNQALINSISRNETGKIMGGEWDAELVDVDSITKIEICRRHWVDGLSWKDAGAYDNMMDIIAKRGGKQADGCRTLDDVIARYDRLDKIFETVQSERRLRSVKEIDPKAIGEAGGIYIHIDRSGRPVFGLGGAHRLAIARILKLDSFPAQIGVVHPGGVRKWRTRYSAG